MSTTVQADEMGRLLLPAALLPGSEPKATYRVEEESGRIIISKEKSKERDRPFWKRATASERVKALDDWIGSMPPGPGLSDYAVSRDSIYH